MSFTSVLSNIANVIRDLSNVILFEFSKYNTETGKNTSLYFTVFWTLPTDINYTYPSRNKFTQTKDGGFLDKFDMGMPKIRMSGTFGKERRGILYLDGLTRLRMFKEMVKYYHTVSSTNNDSAGFFNMIAVGVGAIGSGMSVKDKLKLKNDEVYAMTMFDFINSEIWVIDPTSLDIIESAKASANLPRYELKMQAICKALGGKVDELLSKTLAVRDAALAADSLMATLLTPLPERFKTQIKPLWTKMKSIFRV